MSNVENYTQDLANFNVLSNRCGLKRAPGTLAKRKLARLLREAMTYFDGFGLDFNQYGEPQAVFFDMTTATVEWTHKQSGQKLILQAIWFSDETGEILQAGSNYGNLEL